ncbi:hypothetical protein H311_00419, partial [Anncaliia algerae PRA109]
MKHFDKFLRYKNKNHCLPMYTFKKINRTCSGEDNQREKNGCKYEYSNLLKNKNTYLLEGLLKSLKISNENYSLLKYKIKINFKDSIIELKKEKRIKRGKNKKLLKSKTFKKSKNFAAMIRENSNTESLYYNLNELKENSFHPKLKNIYINDTIIENTLD